MTILLYLMTATLPTYCPSKDSNPNSGRNVPS